MTLCAKSTVEEMRLERNAKKDISKRAIAARICGEPGSTAGNGRAAAIAVHPFPAFSLKVKAVVVRCNFGVY